MICSSFILFVLLFLIFAFHLMDFTYFFDYLYLLHFCWTGVRRWCHQDLQAFQLKNISTSFG